MPDLEQPEVIDRGTALSCAATAMMFCAEAETWPVFAAWLFPVRTAAHLERAGFRRAGDTRGMRQSALTAYALAHMPATPASSLQWKTDAVMAVRFCAEPETWPVFTAWAGRPENPAVVAEFLAGREPHATADAVVVEVCHA